MRQRDVRARLQIEADDEDGTAHGILHGHAPAGEILNVRIAHCRFEIAYLPRGMRTRGMQPRQVLTLRITEYTMPVGEMKKVTRHGTLPNEPSP